MVYGIVLPSISCFCGTVEPVQGDHRHVFRHPVRWDLRIHVLFEHFEQRSSRNKPPKFISQKYPTQTVYHGFLFFSSERNRKAFDVWKPSYAQHARCWMSWDHQGLFFFSYDMLHWNIRWNIISMLTIMFPCSIIFHSYEHCKKFVWTVFGP